MPDAHFGVVLDSSSAIAHLREPIDVFALGSGVSLFITLTSLGELLKGALKSKRPAHRRQQIDEFLRTVHVISLDELTCAEVAVSLERTGRRIPENDMWIAAMAIQAGFPLASRDAHFDRVDGLDVLRW